MSSRVTSVTIFALWSGAMSWLVWHDVWPAWTAQDIPKLASSDWIEREGREAQWGLYDGRSRIGTLWTSYRIDQDTVQRNDLLMVERFPGGVGALRVDTDFNFRREPGGGDLHLDEFTLKAYGAGVEAVLHGERFPSVFSFQLKLGAYTRQFKVPLERAGMITGAFSPLAQMENLQVGQRWRVQVANPIATITGIGEPFLPMIVEVTGEEKIATAFGERWCRVLQARGAKMWVSDTGVVERQEMTLPVGVFRLEREPFHERAYQQARTVSPVSAVEERR